MANKHPIQPLGILRDVLRFKSNEIVIFLLDNGKHDMNSLAMQEFSQEDREQFAQLIGYSLSGFGELSYVSDDTYDAAEKMANEGLSEKDARLNDLQEKIDKVRKGMAEAISKLYGIHIEHFTGQ